jgi:hypothetical protein
MSWIALIVLASALAQSQPATAPASKPPPLLSGPAAVEDNPGRPTLVVRTFDGRVERIAAEPEATAIGLIALTPEQRTRFESIRSARMTMFDQIVRANYGLIVELASLQGDTDARRRFEALTRATTAFKPYTDRGTVYQEMWPHLTDAQRREVQDILSEYRAARLASIKREAGDASPRALAVRDRIESLGELIRESIERQVGLEREQFAALAEELMLTPEQRNAAEAIFGPLTIKRFQNLEVTPAERSKAFAEFNQLLDDAQRRKVLSILVRQYGRHSATQPATQPASQPIASQP